jgi:5-methylcytosine-specific restriction endonuclease McrA
MVNAAVKAQPYCSLCGSTEDLTGDHITPLAVGGLNTPRNIRVLCRSCNSSKGAKTKINLRPRIHVPSVDVDDDPPTVG